MGRIAALPRPIVSLGVLAIAAASLGATAFFGSTMSGCGTVDLGVNEGVTDIQLDENYFYCVVNPQVIIAKKCSPGDASQGDAVGGCHSNKSAMILADVETPTPCDATGKPTATPSAGERQNYQQTQLRTLRDVDASPLILEPTQQETHPRQIFPLTDPAVDILRQWISGAD